MLVLEDKYKKIEKEKNWASRGGKEYIQRHGGVEECVYV